MRQGITPNHSPPPWITHRVLPTLQLLILAQIKPLEYHIFRLCLWMRWTRPSKRSRMSSGSISGLRPDTGSKLMPTKLWSEAKIAHHWWTSTASEAFHATVHSLRGRMIGPLDVVESGALISPRGPWKGQLYTSAPTTTTINLTSVLMLLVSDGKRAGPTAQLGRLFANLS